MKNPSLIQILIVVCIIGIGGAIVAGSCMGVSQEDAERTLKAHGMSNIEITGHAWTGCGKGDNFRSHFTAKNVKGEAVDGTICCGWMKDCTVRF